MTRAGIISNINYTQNRLLENRLCQEELKEELEVYKEQLLQKDKNENFIIQFTNIALIGFSVFTFYYIVKKWFTDEN